MTTLYVDSRLEKPVMPISAGTCPTEILMADPVMNADMAANEMKSTIRPRRTNPMKQMMAPATIASAEAIT